MTGRGERRHYSLMKVKAKRLCFVCLLLLFVGASVGWVFYIPYDARRLYRAIPQNASFISQHEKLAERWKTVITNPLTLSVLPVLGISREEVTLAANDPGFSDMVRKIAARDTVIAYVPQLDNRSGPAWVLSSWIGGQGQLLNWEASLGFFRQLNLKKLNLGGGRSAWVIDLSPDASPTFSKLSLAIVDGVFLACLSSDPEGVKHMMRRVEGGRASIYPHLRERVVLARAAKSGGAVGPGDVPEVFDRGWVSWFWRGPGIRKFIAFKYEVSLHEEGGSEGWVQGSFKLPPSDFRVEADAGLERLSRIMGDAPSAIVTVPWSYIEPFICGDYVPRGMAAAARILKAGAVNKGPVFACLCSGAYSGEIAGLKVPTVMMGIRIKDADKVPDMLRHILDRLNVQFDWGLILRRVTLSGRPVIATTGDRGEIATNKTVMVLESTRSESVVRLGPLERPSVAVEGDWLILSSNMGGWGKLISGNNGGSAGRWMPGGGDGASPAYAWLDLAAVSKALRNAIAIYSMGLLLDSGEDARELRGVLDEARAWLELVAPLKRGILWTSSEGVDRRIWFKFGDVVEGKR